MDNLKTVSVCLASYNGEKYIEDQIESIMVGLNENDELIVSDDGSKDNTKGVVEKLMEKYKNIKLVDGPHHGFSCNFGNAIAHCTKDVILFSDQDDIWDKTKIDKVRKAFADDSVTTVLHRIATFRNDELKDTNEITINYKRGAFNNFVKSCYWGCCMGVRRDFVEKFTPFRDYCVGHDQLIGLMSEKYGKTYFIGDKLIFHRLHSSNTSNKRTFKQMYDFRVELRKDYKYANKLYKERCGK